MKTKMLLNDIPAGKFHSAILTTYSVSLYYLEQQVLPLLAIKGIHYVSLLADGAMLSKQLASYSALSESRRRSYALHGIQCNGAFHPKIIFLAGDQHVLALIGSGNLTSAGHGKNLESWNAVYVERADDPRMGLISDVWVFLKKLHLNLGSAAQHKLTTIAENCSLLQETIENNTDIRFLGSGDALSVFDQLKTYVGKQAVGAIYVMSPYYDINGTFLRQLADVFQPKRINVILQEDFGMIPHQMKPLPMIHFYRWASKDFKQDYFHAKHLIFETAERNFMYTGSANASIAAFGGSGFPGVNVEAGLLYRGRGIDYFGQLGVSLQEPVRLDELKVLAFEEEASSPATVLVYILMAERQRDELRFMVIAKQAQKDVGIFIYSSQGLVAGGTPIELVGGESEFRVNLTQQDLLYAELCCNGQRISNRQFIIDIEVFESTNPSPQNRSLNEIRKLVESGSFSSQKIIEYLNTIHQQQPSKTNSGTAKSPERGSEQWFQENEALMYLSYHEIRERIKLIEKPAHTKIESNYKSVKLWDSIFAYLKEAKKNREEAAIDEEETEDIHKSTGRIIDVRTAQKRMVSLSEFDRSSRKVNDFLWDYVELLQAKTDDDNAGKPNLIDLTMFLIVLEILLHLFSHKEKIKEQDTEQPLLAIGFSEKINSWSDYVLHVIGAFTLWCSRQNGFSIQVGEEYNVKMSNYIQMAYKTSVSALSIFSIVNRQHYKTAKVDIWLLLGLKNIERCFNLFGDASQEPDDYLFFVPEDTQEELGIANLRAILRESLLQIKTALAENEWYDHPADGMTYIGRKIPDTGEVKFLKLIHPGYSWSAEIDDYWNERVFSLNDWRWRKTKV